MGYTTDFTGCVRIEPPLNATEAEFLQRFADSRRMRYVEGPYVVDESRPVTEGGYNLPSDGQPGLWCQWVPCEAVAADNRVHPAAALEWDQGEKFYESAEWMKYLIDHFLKPGAAAEGQPGFEAFTFDHVVNGEIWAQGEDPQDMWNLIVNDNVVKTAQALIAWAEPEDVT